MLKIPRFTILGLILIATGCAFSGQATSRPLDTTQPFIPQSPISTSASAIPTLTTLLEASPYSPPPSLPLSSLVPTMTPTSWPIRPTPTLPPALSSLRIAFTHDKELWLWQNGMAIPLISSEGSSQPHISHDGEVVAFVWNGLLAINSNGTNERQLLSVDDFKSMKPREPGVGLAQFDWIPGTHMLLFNTQLALNYGLGYTDDLYVVNAETRQWAMLRHPGEGGKFLISPDGQRVVMTTSSRISVMRVDGSDYRTLLKYPTVRIPSEFAYYAQPIWAPDSQSLMVAIPPQDLYYGTTSPTTIWHLPIDRMPPTIVSQLPAGYGTFISPDLSKVVSLRFVRQEADTSMIYEMHISKIDGSDDIVYRTDAMVFQNWASDSEHFVLWLERAQRYYLGKAGTDLVPLTEPSCNVGSFSWIDSSHFIYLGGTAGLCELRLGVVGEPSILVATSKTTYDDMRYDFTR
jgi:hypothetical protein